MASERDKYYGKINDGSGKTQKLGFSLTKPPSFGIGYGGGVLPSSLSAGVDSGALDNFAQRANTYENGLTARSARKNFANARTDRLGEASANQQGSLSSLIYGAPRSGQSEYTEDIAGDVGLNTNLGTAKRGLLDSLLQQSNAYAGVDAAETNRLASLRDTVLGSEINKDTYARKNRQGLETSLAALGPGGGTPSLVSSLFKGIF